MGSRRYRCTNDLSWFLDTQDRIDRPRLLSRRRVLSRGYVEPAPEQGEAYDPDSDAENYGVSLVQEGVGILEENVEIARMDTCHGQPHLDKEYLPPDVEEDEKLWLEDGYSYERMKRYLLETWQHFADLHVQYD